MTRAVDIEGRGVRVNGRSVGVGSAIPDSAVAQYDPSAEAYSNGESISTQTDQINSFDLSGRATYQTNVQNSEPVVRYDGVDDGFGITASNWTTVTQPCTVIAVVVDAVQSTSEDSSDSEAIFWNEDSNDPVFLLQWFTKTGTWNTNAGDGFVSPTDSAPVIVSAVFDGADSEIRAVKNGTVNSVTGDAGPNDMESFAIGRKTDGTRAWDGDQGEVIAYDSDLRATGELTDEESRLAEKYGI